MSKYKKKKKNNGFIFGLSFFGSVIVIGLFYVSLSLAANYISHLLLEAREEPIEVVTDEEDIEAILLATKNKAIESNIFIQCIYGDSSEVGSGTIIDEDELYYYALTNEHVLDGNGNVIDSQQVITSDGVTSDFEIIKISEERDLAYIRFEKSNREDITPINYGSNIIHLDTLIIAVGNPYGNNAIVNYGNLIRSTYLQELEIQRTVIEHDAVLANGSSGGALLDMYGNLIGINTWELNGLYYAIPLSVIQIFLEE